jgi:hypothetical protein
VSRLGGSGGSRHVDSGRRGDPVSQEGEVDAALQIEFGVTKLLLLDTMLTSFEVDAAAKAKA